MSVDELQYAMWAFRTYHQAKRQDTPTAEALRRGERLRERREEKFAAKPATQSLEEMR